MKNFNDSALLIDAVVDAHRTMQKLADSGSSVDRCADVREKSQRLNVVEEAAPETVSSLRAIRTDVIQDSFQIG
jgi:hypothetical protein